ncbi:hypothetical protein [Symbiopectobacterium sp. RP]|uniref:hypothetical protein n=1 Tax=Symbiopectobacterium sp. RP TaxID=3248553 RepID=UPI003D26E26A
MGTSKKQKKREWLRYRDFVLSPYGVIKIKSLCYIIDTAVFERLFVKHAQTERHTLGIFFDFAGSHPPLSSSDAVAGCTVSAGIAATAPYIITIYPAHAHSGYMTRL